MIDVSIKQGDRVLIGGQYVGISGNYSVHPQSSTITKLTLDVWCSPPASTPPLTTATNLVFGNPGYKKPYRGNLVGNIRIKYRIEDYAKVYVRDPHRIRCYLLKDMGEYVTHSIEIDQTHRTQPRTMTYEP